MPQATTADNPLHSIPVIGWIARDIAEEPESLWYAVVIVLTLFILALMAWGIKVLSLLALATVPVIFVILMLITRG